MRQFAHMCLYYMRNPREGGNGNVAGERKLQQVLLAALLAVFASLSKKNEKLNFTLSKWQKRRRKQEDTKPDEICFVFQVLV